MIDNASEPEDERKQAEELLLSVHLNLALVYLKLTPVDYFLAKDHAVKALQYDEKNVKGLFRKGQAFLGLGEAEEALKDFEKILETEPQNKVTVAYFSFKAMCEKKLSERLRIIFNAYVIIEEMYFQIFYLIKF